MLNLRRARTHTHMHMHGRTYAQKKEEKGRFGGLFFGGGSTPMSHPKAEEQVPYIVI